MKKSVWISVVVLLAVTVLVVAGAVTLLRDDGPAGQPDRVDSAEGSGEQVAAKEGSRPECASTSVGGVELPCMGAQAASDATPAEQITVVSVWAWWCEPCREELPALNEFAHAHPEYRVVGVHADKNEAAGAALLDELNVDLPSYQDGSNTFAGTHGLPPVVPVMAVFRGDEQVGVFPTPFTSADEIAQAVEGVV